jgi:hypothetical protein
MFVFTEDDLRYALGVVHGGGESEDPATNGGARFWYPKFEKALRQRRAMQLVVPGATDAPVPYATAVPVPAVSGTVRISSVYGQNWPEICDKARELAGMPYGEVSLLQKDSAMWWHQTKGAYYANVEVRSRS